MKRSLAIVILLTANVFLALAQEKTAESFYQSGLGQFTKNDYDSALMALGESLAIDSTHEKSLYLKAYIYNEQEEIEKAMATYNRLLAVNPRHEDGLYNRALLKMTTEDFEGAEADYDLAIVLNEKDPDLYLKRGYCHQLQENLPEALADFSTAIELDSTLTEAYAYRGLGKITLLLLEDKGKPTYKRTRSACEDLKAASTMEDPTINDLISKYCPKKKRD